MPSCKIVLDTNCLLRSVSRRSAYTAILDKLYDNSYELYVTTDILLEYEEKLAEIFSKETAELVMGAFSLLHNVKKTDIHFHLNLIHSDPDDNKFVDCAFAGNVHFLVTNDKHYNILKSVSFPAINVITLDEFKELLTKT
ncbi:MAG: putative toxin-antitoxin system toxin component, PIN family [Chitinophagaceae bacterium]|nr:putative toxin-antitoxin system toxin component, PIN family [Chitinophagaceae bacterium]